MTIPLWSQTDKNARDVLSPLESTEWNDLTEAQKKNIWKYIEHYLFDPQLHSSDRYSFSGIDCNYKFYGNSDSVRTRQAENLAATIDLLNSRHKRNSYANNFLASPTYDNACKDFFRIFIASPKDVVFELLTIFADILVKRPVKETWKKQDEISEDYKSRKDMERWKYFDDFSDELNEVLQQFGINYQLTRNGLIPADEPEVINKIYKPVLKKLASKKWEPVNRDLADSFKSLVSEKGGSNALTHALSALQAFLQILDSGKTGKGDTVQLIKKLMQAKKIPDDDFTKMIVTNMNSYWAKERMDKGDPHPKNQYATKQQAKLVVSTVMVFMDHVL